MLTMCTIAVLNIFSVPAGPRLLVRCPLELL